MPIISSLIFSINSLLLPNKKMKGKSIHFSFCPFYLKEEKLKIINIIEYILQFCIDLLKNSHVINNCMPSCNLNLVL